MNVKTSHQRIAELLASDSADYEVERLILDTTELLLALMEREHVSRTELASRIGKSKGHVSQLLTGERNMTLRTLAEVTHAVGHRMQIEAHPITADGPPLKARDLKSVFGVVSEHPYPLRDGIAGQLAAQGSVALPNREGPRTRDTNVRNQRVAAGHRSLRHIPSPAKWESLRVVSASSESGSGADPIDEAEFVVA
jgi:transcriptional regulator with XRE-family HTH domain